MSDNAVFVVCVPVAELAHPFRGSVIRRCSKCGREVWVDGRYVGDIEPAAAQIICWHEVDNITKAGKVEFDWIGNLGRKK